MTLLNSLSLLGAMFILAVSPGPGIFAVVSRALTSGFNHAAVMVIGLILGDLVYLLLAIYGLSTVAQLLGELFLYVKYFAGVYLIYLGYKIFISEVKKVNLSTKKELSWKANFFSGLFITLSNPKVIVFYLGFLPAFMDLSSLKTIDVMIVVIIVTLTLAVVVLTYAYLASKTKNLFKSEKAMKNINRSSGVIMMGVGSLLILK